MMVKAVIDHGWYLTNAQLGAPGVLTLHDFPQADGIHLLLIKLLSCFSTDWALLFNVYYLLGFPLDRAVGVRGAPPFSVAPVPAFVASLLYAFLPSRLMIGELHFFLAGFYPGAARDPAGAVGRGRRSAPARVRREAPWRPRLALRRRRSVAAIAIALLIAGTGVYYAFFAGVLIVFAGAWSAVERRSPRHALAGLALTALIVAGLTVQSIPTLLYHRAMGPNPDAAARPVAEAEIVRAADRADAAAGARSQDRGARGGHASLRAVERRCRGGGGGQPRRRGRGRLPDPARPRHRRGGARRAPAEDPGGAVSRRSRG